MQSKIEQLPNNELSQSYKKHKFSLNLRENNLDDVEVRQQTEGTNIGDELADNCG